MEILRSKYHIDIILNGDVGLGLNLVFFPKGECK